MSFLIDYQELPELSKYVTVSDLIKEGIDFTGPDKNGAYPLQPVCEALVVDYVQDLMEASANVNVRDACGYTPLLSVIECCHFDPIAAISIIRLLLDNGADIEGRGEWDKTPFLKSCTRGEIQVTQYLIERGCDIHAVANEIGGPMGAKEFSYIPSVSSEFREYICGLYHS